MGLAEGVECDIMNVSIFHMINRSPQQTKDGTQQRAVFCLVRIEQKGLEGAR